MWAAPFGGSSAMHVDIRAGAARLTGSAPARSTSIAWIARLAGLARRLLRHRQGQPRVRVSSSERLAGVAAERHRPGGGDPLRRARVAGDFRRRVPGQRADHRLGARLPRHRRRQHARGAGGRLAGDAIRARLAGVRDREHGAAIRLLRRPGGADRERDARRRQPRPRRPRGVGAVRPDLAHLVDRRHGRRDPDRAHPPDLEPGALAQSPRPRPARRDRGRGGGDDVGRRGSCSAECCRLPSIGYPSFFICFPPLLWPVFRLGRPGTVAALGALAGVALVGTIAGHGPFAQFDLNTSLLLVQLFTAHHHRDEPGAGGVGGRAQPSLGGAAAQRA